MSIVYDCHIHLMPFKNETPEQFRAKAESAGIGGGQIFSLPPQDFLAWQGAAAPCWKDRIANVLDFCGKLENYYPFLWINPTEPDAVEQVEYAKNAGIRGLKVLCSSYMPSDGIPVYRRAAELRMPILFHSGILWDGMPSSPFNRPCNFECMLDVPYSRFAVAHVSWPWTDECIALFGKLRQAHEYRKDAPDFYVDCSPGAADIFREDIFRKFVLLRCGIENKLLFGVDSWANEYNAEWAKYTLEFDRNLFESLQQKYGSWQGMIPSGSELEKMSDEDRNPFRKTFVNATTKNMLNFLKEW